MLSSQPPQGHIAPMTWHSTSASASSSAAMPTAMAAAPRILVDNPVAQQRAKAARRPSFFQAKSLRIITSAPALFYHRPALASASPLATSPPLPTAGAASASSEKQGQGGGTHANAGERQAVVDELIRLGFSELQVARVKLERQARQASEQAWGQEQQQEGDVEGGEAPDTYPFMPPLDCPDGSEAADEVEGAIKAQQAERPATVRFRGHVVQLDGLGDVCSEGRPTPYRVFYDNLYGFAYRTTCKVLELLGSTPARSEASPGGGTGSGSSAAHTVAKLVTLPIVVAAVGIIEWPFFVALSLSGKVEGQLGEDAQGGLQALLMAQICLYLFWAQLSLITRGDGLLRGPTYMDLGMRPGDLPMVLRLLLQRGTAPECMVSYTWSGPNRDLARRLAARVLHRDDTWVDARALATGHAVMRETVAAARTARVMFIFLCPEYMGRIACALELYTAFAARAYPCLTVAVVRDEDFTSSPLGVCTARDGKGGFMLVDLSKGGKEAARAKADAAGYDLQEGPAAKTAAMKDLAQAIRNTLASADINVVSTTAELVSFAYRHVVRAPLDSEQEVRACAQWWMTNGVPRQYRTVGVEAEEDGRKKGKQATLTICPPGLAAKPGRSGLDDSGERLEDSDVVVACGDVFIRGDGSTVGRRYVVTAVARALRVAKTNWIIMVVLAMGYGAWAQVKVSLPLLTTMFVIPGWMLIYAPLWGLYMDRFTASSHTGSMCDPRLFPLSVAAWCNTVGAEVESAKGQGRAAGRSGSSVGSDRGPSRGPDASPSPSSPPIPMAPPALSPRSLSPTPSSSGRGNILPPIRVVLLHGGDPAAASHMAGSHSHVRTAVLGRAGGASSPGLDHKAQAAAGTIPSTAVPGASPSATGATTGPAPPMPLPTVASNLKVFLDACMCGRDEGVNTSSGRALTAWMARKAPAFNKAALPWKEDPLQVSCGSLHSPAFLAELGYGSGRGPAPGVLSVFFLETPRDALQWASLTGQGTSKAWPAHAYVLVATKALMAKAWRRNTEAVPMGEGQPVGATAAGAGTAVEQASVTVAGNTLTLASSISGGLEAEQVVALGHLEAHIAIIAAPGEGGDKFTHGADAASGKPSLVHAVLDDMGRKIGPLLVTVGRGAAAAQAERGGWKSPGATSPVAAGAPY